MGGSNVLEGISYLPRNETISGALTRWVPTFEAHTHTQIPVNCMCGFEGGGGWQKLVWVQHRQALFRIRINQHVRLVRRCVCKTEERRSVVCHIIKSAYFYTHTYSVVMHHAPARLFLRKNVSCVLPYSTHPN